MERFYNPKTGLSGIYSMYKGQNQYTLKQIKEMIQNKEAYQLNKQKVKTYYFPVVGHGKGSYCADLMFLDNDRGYNNILCIINLITRVAYAYPQKSKADTYDNLKKFLNEVDDVNHLQTDNGSEFTNKRVKELFKDINYYQVDTDYAQGKIERFNQTLRRLITMYQSAYKTTEWYDVIPDLLHNYNHRYHRSIGMAPVEANEDDVLKMELAKYAAAMQQFKQFKVGDKVRILQNKDIFQKGRAEWSNDVYKIEKIVGYRLFVNGEYYQHHQLQKIGAVHTKLLDNNDVVDKQAIRKEKKIVRDIRKEGVDSNNIREKRVREIKFDKSLVGRRIDRGDGETGRIEKYEDDGDFKWFVKYDKRAKMKSEWMDKGEVEQFLVR